MKRFFYGALVGATLAVALLVSLVAFAQDGIASFVRPLVVDVQQSVPVVADVLVPLDDGTQVTATVPLTLDISLQIAVTGAISESVRVVEETEPVVTVEEVEPAPRAEALGDLALVAFNELPPLDPGADGEVSVIATGAPYEFGSYVRLPVVVRNNTDLAVEGVNISAVAYDAVGGMLGIGGGDTLVPTAMEPGAVSFGYVLFSDVALAEDGSVEMEVTFDEVDGDSSFRNLAIDQQNLVGESIVGMLVNQYDHEVTGPIAVSAACFSADGAMGSIYENYTQKEEAEPGETIPFQVEIEAPCDLYLLAARGYD